MGKVEVGSQRDIRTCSIKENAELRAEPRVEIQQVVIPGAFVEADIEVEKAPVPKSGEQFSDLDAQLFVCRRAAEARCFYRLKDGGGF